MENFHKWLLYFLEFDKFIMTNEGLSLLSPSPSSPPLLNFIPLILPADSYSSLTSSLRVPLIYKVVGEFISHIMNT